jgi:hypothetical protein
MGVRCWKWQKLEAWRAVENDTSCWAAKRAEASDAA